jgi:hypothetical protein
MFLPFDLWCPMLTSVIDALKTPTRAEINVVDLHIH